MRVLLVYYSRTGRTKDIALAIKSKLECDIVEIHDKANRKGFMGYVKSSLQTILGQQTELNIIDHNPKDYELVIIGTPIWVQNMSVPIRTYLYQFGNKMQEVAFFCTMGGSGFETTFRKMADLSTGNPKATLAITEESVKKRKYDDDVEAFVKEIDKVLNPEIEEVKG